MKERPILFSARDVRALLDGRKTQDRRPVMPQPVDPYTGRDLPAGARPDALPACPYGAPGDRLWVRETWAWDGAASRLVEYRADWSCRRDPPGVRCEHGPDRWRPSIHMPRWAARIVLEVTSVRVERLHAITPADAIAEGIRPAANSITIDCDTPNPADSYRSLWESINGPGSWRSNPWVWVLGLRRVTS